VLLTIHQPSTMIYQQLDALVLMAEGRCIYSGAVSAAGSWFAGAGLRAPSGIAECEYFLSVASVDLESAEPEREAHAQIERLAGLTRAQLARAAAERPHVRLSALAPAEEGGPRASWGTQFVLLLLRAWRQVSRARAALVIKVVQQVLMALIYGAIFELDSSARSVQDRLGLLSLVVTGGANVGIASTIRTFPREKNLVMEERAKRLYHVTPYVRAGEGDAPPGETRTATRARARCACCSPFSRADVLASLAPSSPPTRLLPCASSARCAALPSVSSPPSCSRTCR
jgi:hypothetical protein